MAESSWPVLEVMREHLQNLIGQGLMTVAELATCRVPMDPTSPAPVGGYIVVCFHINSSTCCCSSVAWSCIS
jgi:hypothetical protein